MFDLARLRLLRELAHRGTMTAVAAALGLTSSAVSQLVAAGLGVGFAPALGLRFPSAEAVVVRTPGGAPLSRRVHALTRGALTASPLVRALLWELASTAK